MSSEKNIHLVAKQLLKFRQNITSHISKIVIGYEEIIDQVLISFLCGGHVLFTGLPGLGKTLFVKTFSTLVDLEFNRIQFTPDLMPSDIIGIEILQQSKSSNSFKFSKGPIFANIILADEINRTPPKTQSALLEAMEEKQITFAGKTSILPYPFFVMGTQNPIEMEGTYPLPEAQLDRFFMSIYLDYPNLEDEKNIALITDSQKNTAKAQKGLLSLKDFKNWQNTIDLVTITETLLEKTIQSIRNTRITKESKLANQYIEYGAGPRATQFLVKAARAHALLNGSSIVTEENIRAVFFPVLRHRIKLNYVGITEKLTEDNFLAECLAL